jgi:hypothetical protein
MKLTTNSILMVLGVLILGLMACIPVTLLAMPLIGPPQSATPDTFPTIQAIVSQTSVALTQTAPTQTPVPPTPTTVPPTNTPAPTAASYCDWVSFVKDVTVPDGTRLAPGETFTKVWRLKNRGTCAWTSDYMLVFTGGSSMGGTTAVRLPGYVAPGQTVDVSVTLTAPLTPGRYTGYWSLRNPSGLIFGYGDQADNSFYVDIRVKEHELVYGTVSGRICYPSEFNPPMTLYFENANTDELIQFSIPENHPTYSVLLPKGRYYAWAWAPNYNLEGAYVHPDRTMKSFYVAGGANVSSIDICDWDVYGHGRGE